MLKIYSKFLDILEYIEKAFLAVTGFALVVILLYPVVMRYIFNSAAAWPEELARYIFIYDVMIAAAIAVRKNSHLQIDMITRNFSEKTNAVFTIVSTLVGMVFLVYLLMYSITLCQTGAKTMCTAIPISMAVPYSCIPLGVCLMLLTSIEVIFKKLRVALGKSEEVDG